MGNTHSNRIDDHRRRSGEQSSRPRNSLQSRPEDGEGELLHLNMQQLNSNYNNQNQKQNTNTNTDSLQFEGHSESLKKRRMPQDAELTIMASTWYRDSHGLYDYEEDSKITIGHFKAQKGFLLQRDKERISLDQFDNFRAMRQNYKYQQELNPQPPEFVKSVATCMFDQNNYWIYHRNYVENSEEEKENPGDKLWLVMKHMVQDKDYDFQQGLGFKLEIGDTIKFGRVRYKVIVINNEKDGLQEYSLLDRFSRNKFNKKGDNKKKKRQNKTAPDNSNFVAGMQQRVPDEDAISDGGAFMRVQTNATFMQRVQSQNTMFGDGPLGPNMDEDLNIDAQDQGGDSFSEDDEEESSSQVQATESDRPSQDFEVGGLESTQQVQPSGQQVPPCFPSEALPGHDAPRGSLNEKRVAHSPNNNQNFLATQGNEGARTHNLGSHRPSVNEALNLNQNESSSDFGRTGTFLFAGFNNANIMQSGISADGFGQTQGLSNLAPDLRSQGLKKKKKMKDKEKLKLKIQQKLQFAKEMEGKVCRICLGEENEGVDPLISPCKCAGTMSHIHLECLREWLNSKMSKKEGENVKTYCWKALECELCKIRFPGQVFSNGTILTDKLKLTPKQLKKLGRPIEILEYEKPEGDYLVIESVTLQNIRIVHVITMNDRTHIRVGRGHEADIRVTDISVSRFHAKINRSDDGEYFVEDNKSKFGTLIQIRKPYLLHKNRSNYIQMGRTMLILRIDEQDYLEQSYREAGFCKRFPCCPRQKRVQKAVKQEVSEFYPAEWEPDEEIGDGDDKNLNTQAAIEQTRDDENLAAQANVTSPRNGVRGSYQIAGFGTSDLRNEEQKQEINRADAPSRVKFPTEANNANSVALQGLELSTINGALNNNQSIKLANATQTLGDETVRGTTNVGHFIQERNPIVISSHENEENQFVTLNGAINSIEEEKTQNNINVQRNINNYADQDIFHMDRSSFTEQLNMVSVDEQNLQSRSFLQNGSQVSIDQNQESNYKTTPGLRDKSFQLPPSDNKIISAEVPVMSVSPNIGLNSGKSHNLLETPSIGIMKTGLDNKTNFKTDMIENNQMGSGLEASQINFDQSVYLNHTQQSQVSPDFKKKVPVKAVDFNESQENMLNSMPTAGAMQIHDEEEKQQNVYSISHSKNGSIASQPELKSPRTKLDHVSEVTEEKEDQNVFSFNKNDARNVRNDTRDEREEMKNQETQENKEDI